MSWNILYPEGYPIGNVVPNNYGAPESEPRPGKGIGTISRKSKKEKWRGRMASNRNARATLNATRKTITASEYHARLQSIACGNG